jgi:hypothetical protein
MEHRQLTVLFGKQIIQSNARLTIAARMHLLTYVHDGFVEFGITCAQCELLHQKAVAHAVALGFVGAGYERVVPLLKRNSVMLDDALDRELVFERA